MPAPLTRTLAAFASELQYDALPRAAVEAVRTGMTDTVGVMFSGRSFPVAGHAHAIAASRGPTGESRVYFGKERASAIDAALINAAAATAGVYDDVAFAGCHTSTILMPALVAEADAVGASGRDVITAYAAAYEVWARLAERDKDSYSSKGWHATACFGALAGATAIANLRRFSPEQTARAMGIASAMTGGITHSFDYDIGPFQVARGASAGVMAARLAGRGMTAADDAIERPGRGLLSALSPRGQVDLDTPIDDMGRSWRLETVGIHVKQYPCGNMLQRALDGALDLIRGNNLKPDDVKEIDALISVAQYEVHKKSPSTSETHIVPSHNIGVAMAAALLDRGLDYKHLAESFYERPEARAIMKRVKVVPDETIPADTVPNQGFSGGIRMRLSDGRTLESPSVPYARGHWTRRLSAEEAWGKFSNCTKEQLAPAAARALFDDLQTLDRLASIRDLNRAA